MVTMPVELSVVKKPQGDEVDAMKGDSMLFVREDGVEAAWAIVDPILNGQDAHRRFRAAGDLWKPIIWLPTWGVGTTLRSTSSRYQCLTGQTAFFSA